MEYNGKYGSYVEVVGRQVKNMEALITDDAQNGELAYSRYSYIQQRMFPNIRFSYIARAGCPQFPNCLRFQNPL